MVFAVPPVPLNLPAGRMILPLGLVAIVKVAIRRFDVHRITIALDAGRGFHLARHSDECKEEGGRHDLQQSKEWFFHGLVRVILR